MARNLKLGGIPYVENGFLSHTIGKFIVVQERCYAHLYHKPYTKDWASCKAKAYERVTKYREQNAEDNSNEL